MVTSLISVKAVQELGAKVGEEVALLIKATSVIAFAKNSFLLFPLHPTGGEGQGEGDDRKTYGNS
jgi:hypothetical protein